MIRALVVLATLTALITATSTQCSPPATTPPAPHPSTSPTSTPDLAGITILPARPSIPGYDRSCSPGHGCVFGPAWTDVDRDGCDTRNQVLHRLHDLDLKPGTHGCVVLSGTYTDPYTGQTHTYRRGDNHTEIDHRLPLAAAWDLGAATWTPEQRTTFANDPTNLVVVTRTTNRTKSDKTPAQWLPDTDPCGYAHHYLNTTRTYHLALPAADATALTHALATC